MLVRLFHDHMFSNVDTFCCGKTIFLISYKSKLEVITNLENIFKQFKQQRRDTFLILVTGNHEANLRI